MTLSPQQLWDRFQKYYTQFPSIGLSIDISRMHFPDDFLPGMKTAFDSAFTAMAELEGGAIANPDEKRMVGHYWLRNPALAPTPEIRQEIEKTEAAIIQFAKEIHSGEIRLGDTLCSDALIVGIGGSALGPQFVGNALGNPAKDRVRLHFLDNTDPDGMDRILDILRPRLSGTLVVVISKSGGTKETRNGMIETKAAYVAAGLDFASHAVAVTGQESELDKLAASEKWLRRFPMWDWVGGRTSETSAVGLLPAALQGIEIKELLAGARACDEVTRVADVGKNPAAQLAAMWFYAGKGKGLKDMVIIPYKDRLELFSKYLQQLVMESLGKDRDLRGRVVNQGIAVYGNKGSTDQHAYIQQLRDGVNNFFVTFIRVLTERSTPAFEVEKGITSGDFLDGFLLGTRKALFEKDRESITLTIDAVSPFSVGMLIALYERAVGLYAQLIGINAYHQPGVEAGKKAAQEILELQRRVAGVLAHKPGAAFTAAEVAEALGVSEATEVIFHILERLAANPGRGVVKGAGGGGVSSKYRSS